MVRFHYIFLFGLLLVLTSCSILKPDPNRCSHCNGFGTIPVPCSWCHSTGDCPHCEYGYVACPFCKGHPGMQYEKNSKKWVACTVCKGKGRNYRDCPFCFNGRCSHCNEKRQKCTFCDGSGKRNLYNSYY